MKKIIDGKTYNTETAKMLGMYQTPGLMFDDYHFCRETLYITKKGTYFIHGHGGALTSYAYVGHGFSSSGDDFQIVTESEAREWAENKLSADEYAEIFGEPEEG